MAKDPAFLFYPGDWLGGTLGMTFEQKGAYIELLMLQFNRGHMTEHMIRHTVGQLWDNLKDKFRMDDSGCYYNERLEIEKENRKIFVESRRNNVSGTNQYTKSKVKKTGHMTSHMEDEDINENKDKNVNVNKGGEKIIFPFESENFKMWWSAWIKYRAEIKKPYKSDLSIQAALKNLSNYTEDVACKMIEQSIENQWQGIFEIKNSNGRKQNSGQIATAATDILRQNRERNNS